MFPTGFDSKGTNFVFYYYYSLGLYVDCESQLHDLKYFTICSLLVLLDFLSRTLGLCRSFSSEMPVGTPSGSS